MNKKNIFIIIVCVLTAQQSNSSWLLPKIAKAASHFTGHVAEVAAAHEVTEKIKEAFSEENIKEHGEAECLNRLEQKLQTMDEQAKYRYSWLVEGTLTSLYNQEKQIELASQHSSSIKEVQRVQMHAISNQLMSSVEQRGALKALNGALKERTAAVNNNIKELGSQQKELMRYAKEDARERKIAKELQLKLTEDTVKVQLCGDSFQSLAIIANACGNRKLANKIHQCGSGITKIYQSHLNITAISSKVAVGALTKGAAAATLATGWVGVGMGLFSIASSLFGDDDDGSEATQAILEGLYQLSQQLAEHHTIMMKEFGGVHEHMHQQDLLMLQSFFELKSGQQDIKERLAKIRQLGESNTLLLQGNVSNVSSSLHSLQRITTDNFYALRFEDVDTLVDETSQMAQTTIKTDAFRGMVDKLVVKATGRAKDNSVTGGLVDIGKSEEITKALQAKDVTNLWSHPAFSNINALRKLAVKKGMVESHAAVVNPVIWLKCCEAVITLFNKKLATSNYPYDAQVQKVDIENLKKLYAEGEKLTKFVEQLGTADNAKKLMQSYTKSMDELANLVKAEMKEYEQARTKEEQSEAKKDIEKEMMQLSTNEVSCERALEITRGTYGSLKVYADAQTANFGPNYLGVRMLNWYHNAWILTQQESDILSEKGVHASLDCQSFITAERKKRIEKMGELEDGIVRKIDVLLSSQTSSIANPKSNILSPKKECSYKTILTLPSAMETLLSQIKPEYFIAEQLGVGALSFEYEIISNDIHLHTFFNPKNGSKKLLTSYKTKFETDSLYSGDTCKEEQLLLFWYGGRYAKSKDTLGYRDTPSGYRICNVLHYPPKEGYKGAKDTFFTDATAVVPNDIEDTHKYMKEQIALAQAQERVKFSNTLTEKVQPSNNSKLYAAVQKVDLHHELLESTLTLAHNEEMESKRNAETFGSFKQAEQGDIYNMGSFTQYLKAYSEQGSSLPKEAYKLPQLITQTKEKMQQAFDDIIGLGLSPQFKRVTSMLSALKQLEQQHAQRVPYTKPEKKQSVSSDIAQQIALLSTENKKLTQTVEGLQEQMATMLSMMKKQMKQQTPSNKRSPMLMKQQTPVRRGSPGKNLITKKLNF